MPLLEGEGVRVGVSCSDSEVDLRSLTSSSESRKPGGQGPVGRVEVSCRLFFSEITEIGRGCDEAEGSSGWNGVCEDCPKDSLGDSAHGRGMAMKLDRKRDVWFVRSLDLTCQRSAGGV